MQPAAAWRVFTSPLAEQTARPRNGGKKRKWMKYRTQNSDSSTIVVVVLHHPLKAKGPSAPSSALPLFVAAALFQRWLMKPRQILAGGSEELARQTGEMRDGGQKGEGGVKSRDYIYLNQHPLVRGREPPSVRAKLSESPPLPFCI